MIAGKSSEPSVLVAEDDREVRECLDVMLRCQGFNVITACDGEELLAHFRRSGDAVAIILDIMMPHLDGFEALKEIRAIDPNIPVVMLSGLSTPLNIVSAMRGGATDFLAKPVSHEELRRVLEHALAPNAARRETPDSVEAPHRAQEMYFGSSPAMVALKSSVRALAASNVPILIEGETGTGKEMLARELHQLSPRADAPFVKLNCAAVPSELLESELFGYERGAFTGAMHRKPGVFELADGGTLLLDEIGDMDIRLQAKLLQVVQDQEFRRLGGRETVRVNVRLLAATHCNLLRAVSNKQFREDLYYRLNVFTLEVPALRDRREDILGIADFLIRKNASLQEPAVPLTDRLRKALVNFDWPGNVRQLENVMRKLLIVRNPNAIAAEIEALQLGSSPVAAAEKSHTRKTAGLKPENARPSLEEVAKAKAEAEAQVILEALQATHWNRKQAALRLQIDYKAFLYKMKKLAIEDRARTELSA